MTITASKNSKWTLTALDCLGRHWHAEYYVNKIREGCVGSTTTFYRNGAESALRSALSFDY